MGEQRKKRVLVCEFHQESNTFNPIVAGYERFLGNEHVEGIEAYHEIKLQPIAPHGMFDAIEEAGGEVIPTIFLNADSGGRVEDAVLQTLINGYVERLLILQLMEFLFLRVSVMSG